MDVIKVGLCPIAGCDDIPLPRKMSEHAAGFDLHAALEDAVEIKPGEFKLVPTGFRVSVPNGFEAQIRPRSGLALNSGITLLNAPGTIDSDYRGEVKVVLINLGDKPFKLNRGDRIAQMVFSRVYNVEFQIGEELDDTNRSEGGFGHTGV